MVHLGQLWRSLGAVWQRFGQTWRHSGHVWHHKNSINPHLQPENKDNPVFTLFFSSPNKLLQLLFKNFVAAFSIKTIDDFLQISMAIEIFDSGPQHDLCAAVHGKSKDTGTDRRKG